MIASATTSASATAAAAAPLGGFAGSSSPSGAANASDAFAALLDGLASADASGDADPALPPQTFSPRFATDTNVAARARKARPSSSTQNDAAEELAGQNIKADDRAAAASMAGLMATIVVPAPLPAADPVSAPPQTATPSPDTTADAGGTTLSGAHAATGSVGGQIDPSPDGAVDINRDQRFDIRNTTNSPSVGSAADQHAPRGSALDPAIADGHAAVASVSAAAKAPGDSSTEPTPTQASAPLSQAPPTAVTQAAQPAIAAAGNANRTSRQSPPVPSSVERDTARRDLEAAVNRVAPEAQAVPRPAAADANGPARSGAIDTHKPSATPAATPDVVSPAPSLSGQSSSNDSDAAASWSRPGGDSQAQAVRSDRSAQPFAHAIDAHVAAPMAAPPVAGPGPLTQSAALGAVSDISTTPSASVPDDMASQIVQGVKLQWNDGVGQAHITLRPEYLGGVTVALHLDQGSVTAVLHADSPAVRSWLESNESTLRQGLSDQGLKLERLVVAEQAPSEEGGAPQDHSSDQREQPRRDRRRSATDGSFEIIL
jgi:flagellar hook-length control protein FliK